MAPRALAIDVGTNTVLGTVGERRGAELHVLYDQERIVGLGRGVDASRNLRPDRIEAALAAIDAHLEAARALGCTRLEAVGTSALRDASNAGAFLGPARSKLNIEVISGQREAALTFAGAGVGLSPWAGHGQAPTQSITVLDIGGGSTEVVWGDAGSGVIEGSVSIDIGSVRLYERCLSNDPASAQDLERLDAQIAAALDQAPSIAGRPLLALAGTAASVAMLAQGRLGTVHGATIAQDTLRDIALQLASLDASQRRSLPGMVAARADVLVVGARILWQVARRCGADSVRISEGGVRHGLLRELLAD